MHIAVQGSDIEMVNWLTSRGARIDACATGLFFQPAQIPRLPDQISNRWWPSMSLCASTEGVVKSARGEVNSRAGCYYGCFPLSFAASIGNVQMAATLVAVGTRLVQNSVHSPSPFTAWLDAQVLKLCHESEEFNEQFQDSMHGSDQVVNMQRLAGLINAQDMHGNTALSMAILHNRPEMIRYLIHISASPSLSLMNAQDRTPLTMSLRQPDIFNLLLKEAFCETIWEYGDSAMTLLSLYQATH